MAEFHPLFPPNEDDDEDSEPPDIQEIYVQRKENGKYVSAPRTFMIGELPNVNALYAEFGGGEYQLTGRDSIHRLRRRVIMQLPGPSKPMFDEVQAPAPKVAATPLNPMMAMMGGAEGGGVMPLIMMMMQNMMTQQQEASRQSMQMFMGFMQTMATGSQADKQAAHDALNRQAERDARAAENQMKMMLELTAARGAGNSTGGEEAFFKGVEFMRHFSTQQIEAMKATAGKGGDFDLEGLLGTALEALQGFKAFQDMSGTGLPGVTPSEVVS